jgi:hypothetical protein
MHGWMYIESDAIKHNRHTDSKYETEIDGFTLLRLVYETLTESIVSKLTHAKPTIKPSLGWYSEMALTLYFKRRVFN